MFNFFKAFAFLFLVASVLGLAGCGEKTSKEQFSDALKKDFEAEVSSKEIAEKIFYQKYIEIQDPKEEILKDFDFDEIDKDNAKYEIWVISLVESIQEGNCTKVDEILKQRPPVTWYGELSLEGIFYQEGICVEKDPAKAAEIYQGIINEGIRSPNAAARLGTLYLRGEGVSQDPDRAESFFQKAVMWSAPLFFGSGNYHSFFDSTTTTDYKIWGLTVRQMEMAFVDIETGPWDLPKALKEKIQWLKRLERNEGERIVEIAQQLLTGEGEYEKDIETALDWVASASDNFGNTDAAYLGAKWLMDESFCTERKINDQFIDCEWEKSYGLSIMEYTAFAENSKAIFFLIDFFLQQPEKEWSDWSLYQYILLAEKDGIEVDKSIKENAKKTLCPSQQRLLKAWVSEEYKLPITDFFPN